MRWIDLCAILALLIAPALAQPLPAYDLLLRGGHVIDATNHIDAVMDVAIKDGHIARVAPNLKPADAIKTIDVQGMYVTPGLIDMHFHAYNGTGERGSYAGDLSVLPDGFTFRSGVTTIVDAGSSGWRNFEDFKDRVIDRSKTRVLAMINIVGAGMRGSHYENNLFDMDAQAAARMAHALPGPGRGHQDRPLRRPGMDAGGAGGDRRHHRQHSGDGGFRRRLASASAL